MPIATLSGMKRAALILAVCAFLGACATTNVKVTAHAVPAASRATEDMECMSECLQDGAEDCETCAVHCLGHTPSNTTHVDEPDGEPDVADNTA
jgi:hypothetical protein